MAGRGSAPGERRGGRQKGVPNKNTSLLKGAILQAAAAVGEDEKGKGGLQGYCKKLAKEQPKAFASLMGRVLPTQVTGDPDNPVVTRIETVVVDAGQNSSD